MSLVRHVMRVALQHTAAALPSVQVILHDESAKAGSPCFFAWRVPLPTNLAGSLD
jgi:hypothetical protein